MPDLIDVTHLSCPATADGETHHLIQIGHEQLCRYCSKTQGELRAIEASRASAAPAYDKATDPYRIDPDVIRRTVWADGTIDGWTDPYQLIQVGEVHTGDSTSYGCALVAIRRTELPENIAYSTHQIVVRSDADSRRLTAQTGHYDMTRAQALEDLRSRGWTL